MFIIDFYFSMIHIVMIPGSIYIKSEHSTFENVIKKRFPCVRFILYDLYCSVTILQF